jgi:hypothetical protein
MIITSVFPLRMGPNRFDYTNRVCSLLTLSIFILLLIMK